ncbi:unnamed protein product [Peniophora sp. CBMAI 1063]|nr:unnamed protein product [Peniophora sp. CBMAI 1063]
MTSQSDVTAGLTLPPQGDVVNALTDTVTHALVQLEVHVTDMNNLVRSTLSGDRDSLALSQLEREIARLHDTLRYEMRAVDMTLKVGLAALRETELSAVPDGLEGGAPSPPT